MKKKMKKENTNAVPDYIDNSFCNIEDILTWCSDDTKK